MCLLVVLTHSELWSVTFNVTLLVFRNFGCDTVPVVYITFSRWLSQYIIDRDNSGNTQRNKVTEMSVLQPSFGYWDIYYPT